MPTEAQIIAQIASLDTMGQAKNASLPNDDIADYPLLNLALLKAIEEKAAASTISYLATALGRRNSATSLSVVLPRTRLIASNIITRPATVTPYASGQLVGDATTSQLVLTNLFGEALIGSNAIIRKITLLRQVATGTLASANYRILTGVVNGFAATADATLPAFTAAQAVGIQSSVTINMTNLISRVQYGEVDLDSSVIASAAIADAYAAIINLGTVTPLAGETFQLFFHVDA